MDIIGLKDKNLYFIGGIVRDELLKRESIDIDLTYNGNAVEFAHSIKNAEILQINEPFGTVKIKLNNKEIDIASTRSEIYPKKGHLPIIKKNALAKSTLTGEIIDYTGGLEDLKNKKIRVLHNNSFIDDPTRILRALKFSVRFGFELDEHTKKLQNEYLKNINYDISYKRLQKELKETLTSWKAFERFVNEGIYKLVSPIDFKLPKFPIKNSKNWIVYLGLLPDISNIPLTKKEKKIVEEYNNLKNIKLDSDFEIYKSLSNISKESIIMYSTINPKIVERFNQIKEIKISLNGEDLQNFGIKPSEKYQQCFDFILKRKLKNPSLSKSEEISIAKEFFEI